MARPVFYLPLEWPVETIRETFFSYFEENQHAKLSSTPVIPVDDPKVPLIHTCLNRFKGTLNGRGRQRTCFSLRCIIASDDDVIDRFRSDANYHRFTEILGSWSFGDYFKEEAIELLFTLLSKKYNLPESRIYATYFSGDTSSCLSSDNESKNTLQKYLGEERIMPSTSKADFWMAGETGPCGPCIGFFVDCSGNQDDVGSVMNITDDKSVEICRLVFVEFNRQADGILEPLQAKHVLTGINFECLATILQKQESHYDLDTYSDILGNIYGRTGSGIECYSGKVGAADTDGIDTAYRLLADHMRMIAVTNAPGSQLGLGKGNEGREYFLKCADKQAVQYGHDVLKTNPEDYDVIVEGILLYEETLCPELEGYRKMDEIVEDEVKILKKTIAELRDQKLPFDMRGKKTKEDVTSVVWYATRVIQFLGHRTPIILKDKDTCCSLIALCNVLLLEKKITLNLDIKKVSEGHLIHLIQSCLLYGDTQIQLEQNLELSESNNRVLGVLPKLPGSLYFDVTFGSSRGFEQTSETALFDFLGVLLHHGWLVDPKDGEWGSRIYKSSCFELSCMLSAYEWISNTNSGPQKHAGCSDDIFYSALELSLTESEKLVEKISTFLRVPQLTSYGFSSLHAHLKEKQLSVLIWNEKLLTVYKVKDQIYVLLNDLSLLSTETGAVWEILTQEKVDGSFVDCGFVRTDSKIQSILPLTKKERKKMKKKQKKGLLVPREKEERNEDGGDEKSEEKDDEKTEDISCTDSMRSYPEGDISLEDFVRIPGNEFSKLRTIFADGTSLDVADTTKTGRVLGHDILEQLFFSHSGRLSWNGKFDLRTIFVIDGVRAEIRAPYCDKFCEEAKLNDFQSYIHTIVRLFEVERVGLPAFFNQLVHKLSNPPCRPSGCNPHQLEGFKCKLDDFWDCVLTTLALRSSLARAGLFAGIHRIRRLAPVDVKRALRSVLSLQNCKVRGDWRANIVATGHPVLKKVLRYTPVNEKAVEDKSVKDEDYGLYNCDAGSLSIFLRQVNEHATPMDDQRERQEEEEKEPFNKLSELDLLTSYHLECQLPIILESLVCCDHIMRAELWEWLKEVLEDYARPEVLGCVRGFGRRDRSCARGFGHR